MKAANDGRLTPTDEGRKRYPRTFGYHPVVSNDPEPRPEPSWPCTCTPACHPRCAGECGCQACGVVFSLFIEDSRFSGPDFDQEAALEAFRAGYHR
jgi:hypothetical protein